MTTRILNLYAGIGGNRKYWEDVDVVAVEWDKRVAKVYRDNFPEDEVIVADAHTFLENHYDDGWDFIWSSPPCPTHSRTQIMMVHSEDERSGSHLKSASFPDMDLYEEIIFLQSFASCDWVVENVTSYYEPLIDPQRIQRHYFWSNFSISDIDTEIDEIARGSVSSWEEHFGFDLSSYSLGDKERKVLRNCTHPEIGKHVLKEQGIETKAASEVEW